MWCPTMGLTILETPIGVPGLVIGINHVTAYYAKVIVIVDGHVASVVATALKTV